jgi:thioredoxin reductase (NADPH)
MKDLIILGNGMAGMTAALYAKRANLDFKLVGKDEYDFGQIGNAILVENFPCAASQSGFELASSLHDQLEANDIIIEEHGAIKITQAMINHYGLGFHINYADGTDDFCKAVIYALGARHRQLNCKIDKEIPIHYCALCDGALYKDKTVAVIGGGDVAFTQAEYLSKICEKVFIIMCDENVTAAPTTFNLVSNIDNVYIEYNYPVDLIRYSKIPSHCRIINKSKDFYFSVDGIFVAIGMIPNTQPIVPSSPIITDTLGYIQADENCKTKINGFFAAGDVRAKSVRQALTAAADGANAVNSVINYLKEANK